jgi:K+-transporting ATPase ATPase C chain
MTNEVLEDEPPDTKTPLLAELRSALVVTVTLMVVCGALFPALVLAGAQTFFPGRADGGLIRNAEGEIIGSRLIGQEFTGAEYFHPRPSGAGADGYDAAASSGRNFAPDHPDLKAAVITAAEAYREENGLSEDVPLPADAVTASAGGLDPHISLANARLQTQRVADTRDMPLEEVQRLVGEHSASRLLGFLGEPRVNVLELNLALDREFPRE